MTTLIHTPEFIYYANAILITQSLGCSNIASHIQSRWFSGSNLNVVRVSWVIKLCIVSFGLLIVPLPELISNSFVMQGLSIVIGVFIGIACACLEIGIQRYYLRNQNRVRSSKNRYVYHLTIHNKTTGLARQESFSKINLKNIHEHHAGLDEQIKIYHLRDVIFVAALEEIIFRGFFWHFASYANNAIWAGLIWAMSVLLFGASHITFGHRQFMSKTILGTCCMLIMVISKSILPAIAIHVMFNVMAYKELQKNMVNHA